LKPLQGDRGFHLIFVEEILKPKLTEELALQIRAELFNGWVKEKIQEIKYELSN
jgi:parvulin-like peptidyl-prolyl isomerase